MNNWINVKENLPDLENIVDIYTANQGRFTDAQYVPDMHAWWLTVEMIWINEDKVTHWMPRPEPPK